ncbi:hypothetical protein HGRIS_013703 [Hohenbuehelia grisea]|uniref:F-box domain-containing protein n=1 Tax=Hohenbuehelia grisea TaxID=104357 RepID=A0ABR3IW73_9AGAR
MPAQISNLPSELLISILNLVDHSDLLRICLLSHHLHHCALSIYFNRCNSSPSDDLSSIQELRLHPYEDPFFRSPQALRAFRLSIFTTEIRHLKCRFEFPEHWLLWQLRWAYRAVEKAERVHEVTLDFSGLPLDLRAFGTPRMKPLDQWQHAFASFTKLALSKRCQILRMIVAGGFMDGTEPVPPFHLSSLKEKVVRAVTHSFKRSASRTTARSELHAFLARLSVPLRSSNLSSLSFMALDKQSQDLKIPLSTISVPALEEFAIWQESIQFSDLIPFLERHPGITSLRVKFLSRALRYVADPPATLPDSFLPKLRYLALMSHHLPWFSALSLPDLRTIELDLHLNFARDFDDVVKNLGSVTDRICGKIRTLVLRVWPEDWAWLSSYQNHRDPVQTEPFPFDQVESLSIYSSDLAALHHIPHQNLSQWLAKFISLRSLCITRSGPQPVSLDEQRTLAHAVFAQCSGLTSLSVNGVAVDRPND